MRKLSFAFVFFLLFAAPAEAYIGPGLGAGVISAVLGVLAAIAMAFVAVLWYPFKRLIRAMKARRGAASGKSAPKSGGREAP